MIIGNYSNFCGTNKLIGTFLWKKKRVERACETLVARVFCAIVKTWMVTGKSDICYICIQMYFCISVFFRVTEILGFLFE